MKTLLSPVERFRSVIEQRLGLNFEDDKADFLAEILRSQSRKNSLVETAYLDQLEVRSENEKWTALSQLLTVPETYFFRYFAQFQAFAEIALSERAQARRAAHHLSILSAGCASGEEAYSLAMMVREVGIDAHCSVSIRGMDINAAMLGKAINGRYSAWSLRETPPAMEQRWFRRQGADFILDDAIRAAVNFEQRNLVEEDSGFWYPESYDIIFCRNVLMYFSAQQARAIVERITRALAPGGYLFLGHAETLRGLSGDFRLCHTHGTFYYQRQVDSRLTAPAVHVPPAQSQDYLALDFSGNACWMEAIQRSTARIQALTTAPATSTGKINPAKYLQASLQDARRLLQQERFAEALDVVRSMPSELAGDAETQLLKAVLCAHNGQLAEAEQVCQLLLERDGLNAGACYVLALCREEAGDNRGALHHNQAAARLDPGFAMPRLHLGLLSRRTGDCEAARRELEHAILLLQREESSRLQLFGGGFSRDALLALCRAELAACGGYP